MAFFSGFSSLAAALGAALAKRHGRSILVDLDLAHVSDVVLRLYHRAGTIEPAGQPINGLPLVRVSRVNLGAVSDDDLVVLYRRAILGLGYLPQETSIFRGLTVEQNISAVLELAEPDKAQTLARDTVFAAVMVILNLLMGLCLLSGAIRHHEQRFQRTGIGLSDEQPGILPMGKWSNPTQR